jgi:hypothetical protein
VALDVKKIADDMAGKMKPILGQRWDEVQSYAREEATKMAAVLAKIELQKLKGTISEQQANILFDMQKNASAAVLAAVHGVGDLAASQAMNAALAYLKDPINEALGFKLL